MRVLGEDPNPVPAHVLANVVTVAIEAAPAAMPPNLKIAATMAMIRKVTVQRNIRLSFNGF